MRSRSIFIFLCLIALMSRYCMPVLNFVVGRSKIKKVDSIKRGRGQTERQTNKQALLFIYIEDE